MHLNREGITMSLKIVEKNQYPPLEGKFNLRILDRQGNLIKTYSDPNLIVTGSKAILATLLGGTGLPISKIGLGTGTGAADIANTTLTSPDYLAFVSVDYPETAVVRFNWYLGYDQLVGKAITEFGLLTSANTLFSRRVYTAINKNADMAFEGSWSIRFYTA